MTSHAAHARPSTSFQPIGSLTRTITRNAASLDSVPTSSSSLPTDLPTTTERAAPSFSIGIPPSGRGLATLNDSANAITLRRTQPLSESQLTRIASSLLLQPLSVRLGSATRYGRKTFTDEFGIYTLDDQPIGTEPTYEASLDLNPDASNAILASALGLSPQEATLGHLVRLSLHKVLGSTEQDRAVLLNDYTQSLSGVPEFVLWLTFRHFMENEPSRFYPSLAAMIEVARSVEDALRQANHSLKKIAPVPSAPRSYRDLPREKWTPDHWQDYVHEAEAIAELAKQNPVVLDAKGWEEIVAKRRQDRDAAHTLHAE